MYTSSYLITVHITDFDPLQHIINLIKGRVGTRRRNDLDTLRVYIVSSAIYQDPQDALHASFSQHNKHNTYIHILNSEVTCFSNQS